MILCCALVFFLFSLRHIIKAFEDKQKIMYRSLFISFFSFLCYISCYLLFFLFVSLLWMCVTVISFNRMEPHSFNQLIISCKYFSSFYFILNTSVCAFLRVTFLWKTRARKNETNGNKTKNQKAWRGIELKDVKYSLERDHRSVSFSFKCLN